MNLLVRCDTFSLILNKKTKKEGQGFLLRFMVSRTTFGVISIN